MENQDKRNNINPNEEQTSEDKNKDSNMPQGNDQTTPKRAKIKPTNKTIIDFQDNTNLKEDEDQITDQGGNMGAVPPGFRSEDQDYYV
jgi:hypothetical protein